MGVASANRHPATAARANTRSARIIFRFIRYRDYINLTAAGAVKSGAKRILTAALNVAARAGPAGSTVTN
jgi:hypothetical protein